MPCDHPGQLSQTDEVVEDKVCKNNMRILSISWVKSGLPEVPSHRLYVYADLLQLGTLHATPSSMQLLYVCLPLLPMAPGAHLARHCLLPGRLIREWVPVGAECLTDLACSNSSSSRQKQKV
jgi:hypothetical protein